MTMLLSAWQMPMFTSKSIISYINMQCQSFTILSDTETQVIEGMLLSGYTVVQFIHSSVVKLQVNQQ